MQLPPISSDDHRLSFLIPVFSPEEQQKIDDDVRSYVTVHNACRSDADRALVTKNMISRMVWTLTTKAQSDANEQLPAGQELTVNETLVAGFHASDAKEYMHARAQQLGLKLEEVNEPIRGGMDMITSNFHWIRRKLKGAIDVSREQFMEGEARQRIAQNLPQGFTF